MIPILRSLFKHPSRQSDAKSSIVENEESIFDDG
jgi:hypothetical protein